MKKVIIEKAPKKKVVIEGLPEAGFGMVFGETSPFYKMANDAKKLKTKIESEKKTPSFRFTGVDLTPISGNPYLQKGMNYLSRGINKIPGVIEYSKTGKISEDNLAPFYSGSMYTPFISEPEITNREIKPYYNKKGELTYGEGGYLPTAQIGKLQGLMQDEFDTTEPFIAEENTDRLVNNFGQRGPYSFQGPEFPSPAEAPVGNSLESVIDQDILPQEPQFDPNATKFANKLNRRLKQNERNDKLKKGFNQYTKGLVQASPAIDALAAGYQFGKGALDMMGSNMQNRMAQAREADMYTQAVFADAMNVTPYETQGYNWLGRNALAADGMQIKQIGGMGEPNVEVEGKEHIKLPNGFSQEIQGKSHAQGGIPLNLPQGTQIFSEKLKDPQTKKSYADLAKKFETKKYVDLLNSKSADPIQKTTAEMMIKQNIAKLEQLFALQEQNKLSGVHGADVQQKAMQEQQQAMAQQQQEQAAMQEEPMMAHGGYHLPQAQAGTNVLPATPNVPFQQGPFVIPPGQNFPAFGGVNIKSYDPKTKQGINTGETNLDIMSNVPTWAQRDLTKWDRAYGFEPGYIQSLANDPVSAKYYSGLPGKDPVAGLYQEYMYDYHLDRLDPKQNFSPEEREASKKALQQMWQPAGSTRYGLSQKIKAKGIDFDKAGYEEYNKLRPSFIDAIGQYRYLEPNEIPAKPTEVKKAEEKKGETTPPTPETITKYVRPEIGLDMAMGIPLPQVYGRDPLNYYKIEPTYIDPRYLDIQPQLNEITRGQRALQSNIGSRGSADMANLLQAQANAAAAQQQAFGQKYNYDRAQDAAAQQFNAQAKAQADQYNQQSWFQQLEDPIRRREGMMDTQRRTDAQQELENARRMQAFYANKGYIDDTFYPFKNMTGEQIAGFFATPQGKQYLQEVSKSKKEETETEEQKAAKAKEAANASVASNKYGGRLRIKPKLKGKFRK